MSVYYFQIFVLVVCSPLLLLSGRTTGYFAGQSTAVVEILQNSAPYLLFFVLVVCSPLLLLAGRTTGYFAGQSTAVVEILQSSAPGQQAAPLISQRLTVFSVLCGSLLFVRL